MLKFKCILNQIQKMYKKHHNSSRKFYLTPLLAASVLTVAMVFAPMQAHADTYDNQISALQAQIAKKDQAVGSLKNQAGSLQSKIDKYANRIAGLQVQIDTNSTKMKDLNQQIKKAKADLAKQKTVLAAVLKNAYFNQSQTPLETLVASNNLGDYFDQQDNQQKLGQQINTTIDKVNDLQDRLNAQKQVISLLLKQQQQDSAELSDAKYQVNVALSNNKSQQGKFNSQVAGMTSKIAELQAQQAEQARQASYNVQGINVSAGTGHGGYPNAWAYAPQDTIVDNWGMYNRECVSYTAYKVSASGRHMPYWGGHGNANQWPASARASGIPMDHNPRVGDVAISMAGQWGHAMYVEKVNGDGTIYVSQYNYGTPGAYSEMTTYASGLYFIHFK